MATEDNFIIEIAEKIAESHESKVLSYLISLERYLDTLVENNEISIAMNTISNTNLTNIMLWEIKNDFSSIEPKSWIDGVNLVNITYRIISQVIPKDSKEEKYYQMEIFPTFINNVLYFSRLMQINYDNSLSPVYSGILNHDDILKQFKKTIDILQSFTIRFSEHLMLIFKSDWFVQVFVSNDEMMSIIMTNLIYHIIISNTSCLKKINEINEDGIGNLLMAILEEIIYHLSISVKEELGESHLRCLVTILQNDSRLISLLNKRCKGIRLLLMRWSHITLSSTKEHVHLRSKSYSTNLKLALELLNQGFYIPTDIGGKMWAVIKLQAWWRGCMERKKLMKTQKSFGKFQSSYRKRRAKERKRDIETRIKKEENFLLQMNHRRLYRAKLEKEAELMEALSPNLVKKYLEKTRLESAIKIQARWRGYKTRKRMVTRKFECIRDRAARKIQFYVRAWLSRRELAATNRLGDDVTDKQSQFMSYLQMIPPGLTAERKAELMKVQNRWLANHKHEFKDKSAKERDDIRFRAQDQYRQYLSKVKNIRRQELKRDALIAQMERDAKLLLDDSPETLEQFSNKIDDDYEGSMKDLEKYHCRIRPYAKKASQMHDISMKMMGKPWWKKLELESQLGFDNEDDFEDENRMDYNLEDKSSKRFVY